MTHGTRQTILTAAALLALPLAGALADDAVPAPADDGVLGPGDPAPALTVATWVKGEAIPAFEKGKVYVVEFWATWCGPCIRSMPHLTDLQAEYGDAGLTVIGVTSADPNNTLDKVREMVEQKGDGMGYTVAWDTERKTNQDWMQAAGQRGIPASFVVDREGRIAFVGHPMWLDVPLERIFAGTWDATTGAQELAEAQNDLGAAFAAGRGSAGDGFDALTEFCTKYPKVGKQFEVTRFNLAVAANRTDAAGELGRRLVSAAREKKDAGQLNELAWNLVDPERQHADRFLDLALEAATAANEFSKGQDGAVLDTLARVHHWRGDLDKAVLLQRDAVAKAAGTAMEEGLKKVLAEYEAEAAARAEAPAEK